MRATIPSHTMIPAGSVIHDGSDVTRFRTITFKEEEYTKKVFEAAGKLRQGYKALYDDSSSEKVAC